MSMSFGLALRERKTGQDHTPVHDRKYRGDAENVKDSGIATTAIPFTGLIDDSCKFTV